MRIYFTADNQAEEKLQKKFSKIISILSNGGVSVMSNLANENLSGFSHQDLERIDQAGEILLEKMDALIIEGTNSTPENAYLIAIALAHQKPILYLSDRGKPTSKNLIHLQKDKNTSKFLYLKYYTEKTLEKDILDFLGIIEKGQGYESPTIKFTLRITSRIERYLHWKTHNTKISKADFLRELVEELINRDENYKKFTSKK